MKKLCKKLSLKLYMSVGILEGLWHLTAREAPQGNIGKLGNDDIALALDYDGDADELISALVECCWLDVSDQHRLIVHDWHEHSDDAADRKLARSGQTYANGAVPRMGKLTSREKERLSEQYGWTKAPMGAQMRPWAPKCAPPVPEPVPVPEPEPEPEPVRGEPNARSISDDLDIHTDQVWASYPTKRANGESGQISFADRQAIAEAIVRDGFEVVIAGTRSYRDATARWPASEKAFIRSAYKFFNEGDYQNDPAVWKRGGKNNPITPIAVLGEPPSAKIRRLEEAARKIVEAEKAEEAILGAPQ